MTSNQLRIRSFKFLSPKKKYVSETIKSSCLLQICFQLTCLALSYDSFQRSKEQFETYFIIIEEYEDILVQDVACLGEAIQNQKKVMSKPLLNASVQVLLNQIIQFEFVFKHKV